MGIGPGAFYNNPQYLRSSSNSYGENVEYVIFLIDRFSMTFDLSYGPHGTIFQNGNIEIRLLDTFRVLKKLSLTNVSRGCMGTPLLTRLYGKFVDL